MHFESWKKFLERYLQHRIESIKRFSKTNKNRLGSLKEHYFHTMNLINCKPAPLFISILKGNLETNVVG